MTGLTPPPFPPQVRLLTGRSLVVEAVQEPESLLRRSECGAGSKAGFGFEPIRAFEALWTLPQYIVTTIDPLP